MGNIHNTCEGNTRSLRYAVREELKHLVDDPSKRALYKLLHSEMQTSENQPRDYPNGSYPNSENSHADFETARSEPEANSPGSPRLIIDETVQVTSGQTDDQPLGQSSPTDQAPRRATPPSSASSETSGSHSRSSTPQPRSRSGSVSAHLAPKKRFLVDYNLQQADRAADTRLRTNSLSAKAPKSAEQSPDSRKSQSISSTDAPKKSTPTGEQTQSGTSEDNDNCIVKVNLKKCIYSILESEPIKQRLGTPPEENTQNSNPERWQSEQELAPNIHPRDLQQQMSAVMKGVSDSHRGSPSSRTSTPQTSEAKSEDSRNTGPLDMLVAQVGSMPSPGEPGASAMPPPATSMLPPPTLRPETEPTDPGHVSQAPDAPTSQQSPVLSAFPRQDDRHQKIAAIRPTPHLPRESQEPHRPELPPETEVETKRLPEQTETLKAVSDVRKMEQKFKDILEKNIAQVYAEQPAAVPPPPGYRSVHPPRASVPSQSYEAQRRGSFSNQIPWSDYKPQTGKEREDILRESRGALVNADRRIESEKDHHLERSRGQEEAPLDLSAKPGESSHDSQSEEMKYREYGPRQTDGQSLGYLSGSGTVYMPQAVFGAPKYPPAARMVHSALPHAPNLPPHELHEPPLIRNPDPNVRNSDTRPRSSEPHVRSTLDPHRQESETYLRVPPDVYSRSSGQVPVKPAGGNLLGDHSPSDVLYLRCNLCNITCGSLNNFRKHFTKAHNQEPTSDSVTIHSISETKSAREETERRAIENEGNWKPPVESRLSVACHLEDSRSVTISPKSLHSLATASPHRTSTHSPVDAERKLLLSDPSSVLTCPQCRLEFPTRDWGVFTRHVKAHETSVSHKDTKEKPGPDVGGSQLVCHLCRSVFAHQELITRHYQTVHNFPTESTDYPCPWCSKTFVHESGLLAHLPEHGDTAISLYMREMKDRSKDAHRQIERGHPQQNMYHSRLEPSTGSYTRRMSFSENMARGIKRPTSDSLPASMEDIKRPRSGSFPNVQDLRDRRSEGTLYQKSEPHAEEILQAKLANVMVSSTKHHFTKYRAGLKAAKRPAQEATGVPAKRPMEQEKGHTPAPPKQTSTRSFIEEMVENTVSELAAHPDNTVCKGPKILPQLFKGDPLEKMYPEHRACDDGKENSKHTSAESGEEGRSAARPSFHQNATEASKHSVSVTYNPPKKIENVRDIIESLVTAEMRSSSMNNTQPMMLHKPSELSRYVQQVAVSRPQIPAGAMGASNAAKHQETLGETINQAIEKSMANCSKEPVIRDEKNASRLWQLMTEEPAFVCQEREKMEYLMQKNSRGNAIRLVPGVNGGPSRDGEEGLKTGETGKSMREICDQIIADSLSSSTAGSAKPGQEKGPTTQAPKLMAQLCGPRYTSETQSIARTKSPQLPPKAATPSATFNHTEFTNASPKKQYLHERWADIKPLAPTTTPPTPTEPSRRPSSSPPKVPSPASVKSEPENRSENGKSSPAVVNSPCESVHTRPNSRDSSSNGTPRPLAISPASSVSPKAVETASEAS